QIVLGIASTFFGLPTRGDICAVFSFYHSDSAIMMIQGVMILQQILAILIHIRVALYLLEIVPDITGFCSRTKTLSRHIDHSHKHIGISVV
ncbi:hypothetical protein PENTCL1PPCAC_27370, partial [Pristionchus entomophagus]